MVRISWPDSSSSTHGRHWGIFSTGRWVRARYSHRIAINEHRLVTMDEERVAFRYKAYRDKSQQKVMWLSGTEFIRRFLLHVLPKGLMRIRHFGFLANRCRVNKLTRIRAALARPTEQPAVLKTASTGYDARWTCPKCTLGCLCVTHTVAPVHWRGG